MAFPETCDTGVEVANRYSADLVVKTLVQLSVRGYARINIVAEEDHINDEAV